MEHSQAHGKRPTTPQYQNQTKTAQDKENYRSVSLMNIDTKILKKYQQPESNDTLKGSYTMIKWNLCKGYKIFQYMQMNHCEITYLQIEE